MMAKDNNNDIAEALIHTKLLHLAIDIKELKTLNKQFVTQDQFAPIKLVVYGLVGIILVTVIVLLLATVMHVRADEQADKGFKHSSDKTLSE